MSAFYAWQAAFGGWLLWEDLPADVRSALEAMVIDEADRFLDLPPPYSTIADTKGEENAWNSLILVFASEAIPAHLHAARWRERSLEYMVSAFATPRDGSSDKRVDGRALRQWLRGANIHNDFTIENHGFVHPDYYMIGPAMSLPSAIIYRLVGKAAPEALSHNIREVYHNLKLFCLPGGDLVYPNGTDRVLHRIDMTATLHVLMERLFQDRDARALAEDALVTLERMQARNPEGRTYVPGEFDHHKPAESHAGLLYSLALIVTKLWDAPTPAKSLDEVWRGLEGARLFEDGRFFLVRTPQAVSSFAWGSRIMGQTTPFRKERIVNPMPLSYIGLHSDIGGAQRQPGRTGIGSAALETAIQRETVKIQTITSGQESGALHATLHTLHGGRSHAFSFTALPSGKSVYTERWGAGDAALGGLVSLLEEPYCVYGPPKRKVEQDEATWLNVDGMLGFAVSGGGGIRTLPDVRNVLVSLNASPQQDAIVVTLPQASAADTRAFASGLTRLKVDHRDVIAVVVDGFVVASNLGPHPIVAVAEHAGRQMPLPINGYSTRVLPVPAP